jgi:hypothetical protein
MNTTTKYWINDLFSGCYDDGYHTVFIPKKMDLQKTTVNTWLDIISRNIDKNVLDEYISANSLRALKNLPKIAKDLKIERETEYILMSSFLNVMIDRENITTEHVEGEDMEEFTKDPYNFDFQISSKDIQKVLEDERSHIVEEEENKQEIFSVKTYGNSSPARCPNCNGKGFFKCENCEGSGREQYIDGYFANGEERIKTGQCSHCYGRGKIACETCNGAGKQQIYANTYQTIKRFEDRKIILQYDCLSSSWGRFYERDERDWYSLYNESINADDADDHFYRLKMKYRYKSYRSMDSWRNMDNNELANCIEKLYQNSNEIIIDNENESILSEIRNKYNTLYRNHKKKAHLTWKGYDLEKGQLGCSLEKHYAIPAIKITFTDTIEQGKHNIFIFENLGKNKQGVVCLLDHIPELSFFKSLFLK